MRKIQTLAIVVISTLLLSSCVVGNARTHKTQVKNINQETAMSRFDGISVAGSMNVELIQGDEYSVLVKGADSESFDKLVIYVKDNTLNIETKNEFFDFVSTNNMREVTVYVTTPDIKDISCAGSGTLTAKKPINTGTLHLSIAGSGDVAFNDQLSCNNLKVDIAGSSDVTFKHLKADILKTSIAGSGSVVYKDMDVDEAVSSIAGSGKIILQGKVSKHSEDVAGSGNIDTKGITQQ
ncbi:MAG: DUF2807 domain-containing protein [Muribaculaceae bacterium]|nr:DUF2807 domain-containing protein [Muribaculaceae bacterium]